MICSEHICEICKTTEGYFHGGIDGERCDNCAELYGCECGCFPGPIREAFAEIMDCHLERNNDDMWEYIPNYEIK